MRCASIEFATSLASSELKTWVVMMRDRGIQLAYTDARAAAARWPDAVSLEPIRMRSACSRSLTAVPAARNSGLLRTSKWTPGWYSAS
jgi:hypothetical protein